MWRYVIAVLTWLALWTAFSITIGFQLSAWYYRKYPERNRSTEQSWRNLFKALKTLLHRWGEPEKVS